MDFGPTEPPRVLVEQWRTRLRESQYSHYEMAKRLNTTNLLLGIPAAVVSTIVGTTLFASLSNNDKLSSDVKVLVALVSIAAAMLSSLQTF
jgi:hypothetical protein